MKTVFEELNELYDKLEEANNNFASDKAKRALMKKYIEVYDKPIVKSECVLHHLDGDHYNASRRNLRHGTAAKNNSNRHTK